MAFARLAIGTAYFIGLLTVAHAQTYHDWGGTVAPGVFPLPYGYTPLAPGQHNVALASPTALVIPGGARYATVCASTAMVRYTTDGVTTPAAALGQPLAAGACVSLSGPAVLGSFRAFSATGTLDVEYFQ